MALTTEMIMNNNGYAAMRDHDNDGMNDAETPTTTTTTFLTSTKSTVHGAYRYDHDNDGIWDATDNDDDNDGLPTGLNKTTATPTGQFDPTTTDSTTTKMTTTMTTASSMNSKLEV